MKKTILLPLAKDPDQKQDFRDWMNAACGTKVLPEIASLYFEEFGAVYFEIYDLLPSRFWLFSGEEWNQVIGQLSTRESRLISLMRLFEREV